MDYKVTITETSQRTVIVKDAPGKEEAIRKVEKLYNNCDIVLDAEDFSEKTFSGEAANENDNKIYTEVYDYADPDM